ncbi:MAG: hypothetical protein GY795_49165 [Desulfobacterales bacterium]|nr:hypothetical protein [Desulfobacterales bacterium]
MKIFKKMTNISNPFSDSETLAQWTVQVLQQNIDKISKWRMLENWMPYTIFADFPMKWYLGDRH